MTLPDLLLPTYRQMLTALDRWLEKAAADRSGGEADALMAARLAPDMFPLSTQVRFACVQALEGLHRLAGEPFPPSHTDLLEEGRRGGDHDGTIAEARARIAETLAVLDGRGTEIATVAAESTIAHALPTGMIFDLTAEQYARDWALGQFYFHVMIAYAILRHQGIALGKADYVAHMFAFLRPGTMPGG